MINDANNKELQAMLKNLELPEVQVPAHQKRLRETLLASDYFAKEDTILSVHSKTKGGINPMKPKKWKLVASFAVLFLAVIAVGVYMTFFTASQAVASLTLQVNPAVTLTISKENTIIDANGLDEKGKALLAELNLTGKEVPEALQAIAAALQKAELLAPVQQIAVALHAIEEKLSEPEQITLADNVRQALLDYLTEQGLPVEVKVVVVTAELVAVAQDIGLLPGDYVDLVAEVGHPLATEALKLQAELSIDPALFKENFSTIGSALVDVRKTGIVAGDALAILRGALIADPELKELTTITSAMIDLHESGSSSAEIMALLSLVEEQVAAGIDRALLLEEITTISAAQIDLIEAGVPAAAALEIIRTALQADPKIEELTTITDAMIDLMEEGLSQEEALDRIRTAIQADPTLQDFDDWVEAPGEAGERPDKPEVGAPDEGADKPDAGYSDEEADKPDEGGPDTGYPDEGADKPDAGGPDEGADKPEDGEPRPNRPQPDKPDEGGPDEGADNPDAGYSDEEADKPDAGAPDEGADKPDAGYSDEEADKPEDGEPQPNRPQPDKPDEGGPDEGADKPEDGDL